MVHVSLVWFLLVVLLSHCPAWTEAKIDTQICSVGNIEAVRIDKETGTLIFVDYVDVDRDKNDTADQGSSSTAVDTNNGTSIPSLVIVSGGNSSNTGTESVGGPSQNETNNDNRRFRNRNLRRGGVFTPDEEDSRNRDLYRMEFEPAWRYYIIADDKLKMDSVMFSRRILDQSSIDEEAETVFYIRLCLCDWTAYGTTTHPESALTPPGQQFYLCPSSTDYCAVPISNTSSLGQCYSLSTQEAVSRNALPLMVLCYLGLILICYGTIHGQTARDYIQSRLCGQNHDDEIVRHIMGEDNAETTRAIRTTRWWARRRAQFEESFTQHIYWIWTNEENMREQRRRARGSPPPELVMKVKRYTVTKTTAGGDSDESKRESTDQVQTFAYNDVNDVTLAITVPMEGEQNATSAHPVFVSDVKTSITPSQACNEVLDDNDETDSPNEQTCPICFVPFTEGDRVGDLQCKHEFHVHCLKSWAQRKNTCPLCNVPLANRIVPVEYDEEETDGNVDRNSGLWPPRHFFIAGVTGRGV